MSKETKNQAMALAGIVVTVVLTALCYHCYFVVDFDKPLPAIDPDVFTCNEDSDCRPNPDNTQDDCRVCNMDIGECEWSGTNNDSDGWYVCDGARDPDCDDGDNSVYPGAVETANLVNDDCDNLIDEGTLSATGTSTLVDHGTCDPAPPEDVCEWAGPVAVYDSPNLAVIWESDEDVSVKRLRTAEISFPGSAEHSDQYIYVGPSGTTTYNMTDPYLTIADGDLGAVWIDHLGGKKLYFAKYGLTGGAPEMMYPTWPSDGVYPDTFPDIPATPIIAARPSASQYAVAFVGETAGVEDVYLARFSQTDGTLVSSDGGDYIALGSTLGSTVTDRPALADAYSGYVIGWVEDNSTIQLVYWAKSGSYDAANIVSYAPAGLSDFRDPVLVASQDHPGDALVYLIFAAKPTGDDQPEVFAVSILINQLDPEDPSAGFGPVLQISDSLNRLSADVSATWWDEAIGIAWSDRRTGRRIWFRRIADLENGSGTLASQEIDVSGGEADEFEGQNPSVVALGSDYDFGIIWSNGTDMFVRKVER